MTRMLAVCVLLAGCGPHHDDELFGPVQNAMVVENVEITRAKMRGDFKEAHARLEHLRQWANTIADPKIKNAVLYNIHLHEVILKDDEHDAKLKSSIPVPPTYNPLASKPGL